MTALGKPWYDDACATAHALELLGERWALLVVRELMFGPRRFAELRAGLPGISANVLTQRLEGLEATGVVVRRAQAYGLTPWGYEAEATIQAISRWAARSPRHDPTLPLSAASMMLSFRTMISRERAAGLAATVGFRFPRDSFVGRLADGGIEIVRGEAEAAQAWFTGAPAALAACVYGGRALAEAGVEASGDLALAERFLTLFVLPPKAP